VDFTTPVPPGNSGPTAGQPQRRLSVIMFTDMVGYSALTQRDERLALQLLEEHRRLVRPLLAAHGGREIKTIGDAFLVEFYSALAAATCAIAIQQALHDHNRSAAPDRRVLMRIGLHAGDVIHQENDVLGDGVNIAARIEPLAEPGGICVSEDVARQIQNKAGHPLVRLGAGDLKNISMPVDIYRVVLPWSKQQPPFAGRLGFLLRRKAVRHALVVVLAGIAILAVELLRHPAPAAPAPAPVNRLAVLPLVNLSGDPRDEYFADGMTEELISSLTTIRELNVIARTSITRFKGTRLDIAEIGRALTVGSLIEGTVRVAGEEARINVTLVEVATQRTIWAGEFTGMIKNVFTVQSAIAASVTEALKVQLLSGERDLLERRTVRSSEAYRQYLLGRAHFNQRTGGEVLKAIDCFALATGLDDTFALAYAGLAEGYTLAGSGGYGTLAHAEANERAQAAARRAVVLDDTLAEAHAALAYVKFRIDWDWPGAEAGFKRALALKPGYARAHETYALFLAIQRRFDEAEAEMRRAVQLDPLSASVNNGLGRILHFQHRYDEAVRQFQKTQGLEPGYAEAWFGIGMTRLAQHRYDDAIAALQTAIAKSGRRPIIIAMLGVAQGRAGRKEEAQKTYAELVEMSRTTPVSPYCLGIIALGLGENDRGFALLDQAYAEREGILIYLPVDPVTAAFSTDPRFGVLVQKMGLAP
jgi:adenylate cyclase